MDFFREPHGDTGLGDAGGGVPADEISLPLSDCGSIDGPNPPPRQSPSRGAGDCITEPEVDNSRISGNYELGWRIQSYARDRPMMSEAGMPPAKCHYFVDEAGDPTLFNRRKQVVVGVQGCSTFFMLGLLDVPAPEQMSQDLNDLRQTMLADPYFKGVPSMQPERRKTAVEFHAKDDIPEVRREVFSLLIRHDLRFFAVVRDKRRIADLVRKHNIEKPRYRYHPNQLYDRSVSRLFKDRLHKEDAYRIVFAARGTSDRTLALRKALESARQNFRRSWGVKAQAPIEVVASVPVNEPSMQAADYFLWALQRLYERREVRYWEYLWPKVKLVHDIDDLGNHDYGEYYTQRNPLTLERLDKRAPGI